MDSKRPSSIDKSVIDRAVSHSDATRLEQLGISSQLERSFSLPSLIGLCLCLMATWEASAAVLAQALLSGGAPCLFYNFVLTILCSLAIGASLAEIASIYPTAGGQYHWVTALFPSWGRKHVGWATGWISVGGQIVFTASPAFACGLLTQGLIILNKGGDYAAPRWHGMLLYWAFLAYATAMNIWGHRLLPTANLISGVVHVVSFVAALAVLAVMAEKNSAHFVFVDVQNLTGWSSDGVAWMVGLVSTIYPFLGYDAACHLSEEIPHAARNVPLAIMGSIGLNGLMGLIFFDVTKNHAAATILSLIVVVIAMAATVAGITSTSRTLWAFARDNATPFSGFLSKVHPREAIPERAIWSIVVLQVLLGFIYLASSTAFNAILSMAVIDMYLSYLLPIVAMLMGRSKLQASDYGPFKLGRVLGIFVNLVSVCWITASVIFMAFPTVMPVTADNMNYSSVVISGWCLFGLVYYVMYGHKKFEMPVVGAGFVAGIPLAADMGA
ncbi:amino acid permease [Fusarium albosuccineum]|uniref:Amino acid permease n=1 Tax=Fusarium albosuccineum TaxID=1237068 RepID=A0A8H4PB80_9HYPO|nr:amino acid permease [Fusarium albosuccineum]